MRILYVASDYGLHLNMTGGAGTHIRGTIEGFRAHGHQMLSIIGGDILWGPTVQGLGGSAGNISTAARRLPLPLRMLAKDARYFYRGLQVVKNSWRQIKSFRPHVVYERAAFMSGAGHIIANILNIPLFIETDGYIVQAYQDQYGIFSKDIAEMIEYRKIKACKKIVVMSDASVDFIARKYRQPASKIVVKTLGVDRKAFQEEQNFKIELRKRYELEDRFIVGLVAGELHHYHGLHLLMDAAERLRTNPEIVIFVLAGGKLAEKYRQEKEARGLDNIIFSGLVNKGIVANYISLFNVGTVPDCVSHMFPIKTLEYGLMGTCPLVPDYAAFDSLFDFDGRKGLLFNPGDSGSLANAIARLANNREKTSHLAQAWKQEVLARYTWDKTVIPVLRAMEEEVACWK